MGTVLHQAHSEFWHDKGNQGSSRPPCIIYVFPPHEKLAFPITCLRIREGPRFVTVNQFARDLDIAEDIFDGNLDERFVIPFWSEHMESSYE
jgi:hypothetical protein